MSARKPRMHGGKRGGRGLIAKLRKPMAPPTRVAEDEKKYSRAHERERLRRERARNGAK